MNLAEEHTWFIESFLTNGYLAVRDRDAFAQFFQNEKDQNEDAVLSAILSQKTDCLFDILTALQEYGVNERLGRLMVRASERESLGHKTYSFTQAQWLFCNILNSVTDGFIEKDVAISAVGKLVDYYVPSQRENLLHAMSKLSKQTLKWIEVDNRVDGLLAFHLDKQYEHGHGDNGLCHEKLFNRIHLRETFKKLVSKNAGSDIYYNLALRLTNDRYIEDFVESVGKEQALKTHNNNYWQENAGLATLLLIQKFGGDVVLKSGFMKKLEDDLSKRKLNSCVSTLMSSDIAMKDDAVVYFVLKNLDQIFRLTSGGMSNPEVLAASVEKSKISYLLKTVLAVVRSYMQPDRRYQTDKELAAKILIPSWSESGLSDITKFYARSFIESTRPLIARALARDVDLLESYLPHFTTAGKDFILNYIHEEQPSNTILNRLPTVRRRLFEMDMGL